MSTDFKINALVKDIRFWIVLFFLIRMYGITMPPLEMGHNWRQTDGMIRDPESHPLSVHQ